MQPKWVFYFNITECYVLTEVFLCREEQLIYDLIRLREEHDNLAAIAGRLSEIIAKDAPPPSRELYKLRMELASALAHHLKSEDWMLYPRLLVSSDKRLGDIARAFCKEMGGLASAFRDYAAQWGAHAIWGDWERYQRETAEIIKALTLRMAREEHDLYPLLEVAGRVAA